MAQLAIKGHATRSKEVIEILEMMGGINECDYRAKHDSFCYYIGNENNIICYDWVVDCCEDEDTLVFTLEEFLEKFPYKVGDKVLYKTYGIYSAIKSMKWNSEKEQVFYRLDSKNLFVATVDELKPYKEENMEVKETLMKIDLTREVSKAEEIEVILGDYKFVLKDGKANFIKTKPKYPKTYEECCKMLGYSGNYNMILTTDVDNKLFNALYRLKVCRDAYWKIAGEQMGLGKPWVPDWGNKEDTKYCITKIDNQVKLLTTDVYNYLLSFPTAEMSNAFKENFDSDIDACKELL